MNIKKISYMSMMVLISFLLLVPSIEAHASSEYYAVGQSKSIKAGVYKNGKLVIGATKSIETRPIDNVADVKGNIFYTEFHKMDIDMSCQRGDRFYTLKMKKGSSTSRSIATISEYMKDLATDGTSLYFVAAKQSYVGNLTRVSADGKNKEVLMKDVEDFWYRASKLYYVKDASIYVLDQKTKKGKLIKVGQKKIKPESYCLGTTIQPGTNALIYREKVSSKQATYLVYEYHTKKIYRFVTKRFERNDSYYNPISVTDVDIRSAEFIHDVGSLILVDAENKKLKELLSSKEASNLFLESSDAVKRTITYVQGTQRYTKHY